jgi:AsmA protein
LDRYLPQKKTATAGTEAASKGSAGQGQTRKTDYEPLRKITLDAKFAIGELKVHGGTMQNINTHLTAQKGILQVSPLSMDLYGGNISSKVTVNVQAQVPVTSLEAKAAKIQVGPLLRDFAAKDVLEGTMAADVALTAKGDSQETVIKNLNGKGELIFTDGAIVGIDLAGMVRNVQASFGLADRPTEKPRTDFAELRAPFTIKNGLFNTPGTALQSPLMRVTASGDANLVNETLDMRVEPKFVATLKGQGDTAERAGLMVPVLVQGTFASPRFSPDLTALLQGQLPDAETVKKVLEQELNPEKILPKDQGGSIEKSIKGLLPQLQFK